MKKYQFNIQVKNVSRLSHAKPIVTVKWDVSRTYNLCKGRRSSSRQRFKYIYTWQRGTLWWHVHAVWLRATVHGAIVIMPTLGTPFPFPQPYQEAKIFLGEWWNTDVEQIVNQANKLGLPPQISDAHTINGKPGPLFPCSETFAMEVESGKTYLLRIINAALNEELFFAIPGHNMTVVEVDTVYTKPFITQALLIAPGQTTNIPVQASQIPNRYYMAARPFMDAPIPVNNKTATAILQYKGVPNTILPILPQLPAPNDTECALSYNKKLRSLNTPQFPANVPLNVDRHLFYTIGLGKKILAPLAKLEHKLQLP